MTSNVDTISVPITTHDQYKDAVALIGEMSGVEGWDLDAEAMATMMALADRITAYEDAHMTPTRGQVSYQPQRLEAGAKRLAA